MRERVHVVGAYGMRNFGDDLFVDCVQQMGSRIWPDASVRALVPMQSRLFQSTGIFGSAFRIICAVVGTVWSTRIAFCGGSIFHDVSGTKKLRTRMSGKRSIEALGVSIGPFASEDAKARVRDLVRRTDRIVVRDPESLIRLEQELGLTSGINVALGGDLVSLHPRLNQVKVKRSDYVTICPSNAAHLDLEMLSHQIIEAINLLQSREKRTPNVRFLALSCSEIDDDRELCRRLQAILGDASIRSEVVGYSDLGLARTVRMIAESRMVWSQRLHGAIVAYLTEVPFIAISHHAKIRDFCDDIEMNSDLVVGVGSAWSPAVEQLIENVEHYGVSPAAYRARANSEYIGIEN